MSAAVRGGGAGCAPPLDPLVEIEKVYNEVLCAHSLQRRPTGLIIYRNHLFHTDFILFD